MFNFDFRYMWHDPKQRKLLLSAAALVLVMTVTLALLWGPSRGESFNIALNDNTNSAVAAAASGDELVVDIAGGVLRPGVYKLAAGSIIDDAIIMAGGFSPQADFPVIEKTINRAEAIKNHSKVYIPKIGDTPVPSEAQVASNSSASSLTPQTSSLVNINTANLATLDTLPGIGPALGQNIIDFRTLNGPFSKLEDLKLVPGIGESKFSKLKDLISL